MLVTHESFVMADELVAQFEEESGYDLVLKASGDAGALTNKLVLTKDNPTGDAVFGIDNTFGSRAIDEGVLEAYDAELPDGRRGLRAGGRRRPGPDAGGHRQRLRQRRRHLVRRPRAMPHRRRPWRT